MIAIIDYEAGNLTSVCKAFAALGIPARITRDHHEILSAKRVVFPGVGNAVSAMESLYRSGLNKVIQQVFSAGVPLLGICLGSQIILERSQEGGVGCLGLVPGQAVRFPQNHADKNQHPLKVPHMGWNSINIKKPHPVLEGIDKDAQFYFVHSFYPKPDKSEHVAATTDYGFGFASILACRNLLATQFHPEKSGRPGLKLLSNFSQWNPSTI